MVRYPIIRASQLAEITRDLIEGLDPPVNSAITWVGRGEEIDLSELAAVTSTMKDVWLDSLTSEVALGAEQFEGRAAGLLHAALDQLPVGVLDDPGFWSYVSVAHLWWFVAIREAGPISKGNHLKYVDGAHPTECVPFRMFLRGQAVRNGDDYSAASALESATDFWRSHVLRVQTGTAPALTRAFVRLQADRRMSTERELRPFARQLNRLWANVVMHQLDDDEADLLMEDLYQRMSAQSGGPDDEIRGS